jgi:hypothetical protein
MPHVAIQEQRERIECTARDILLEEQVSSKNFHQRIQRDEAMYCFGNTGETGTQKARSSGLAVDHK